MMISLHKIPSRNLVYKTKIGNEKISVFLHGYWGLILLSENSLVRCELLHGAVILDDSGWCLSRYADEVSLKLNKLNDIELAEFIKEFGFKKHKNRFEISQTDHLNDFHKSPCFSKLNSWVIKHPNLAEKYFMSPYIETSVKDYMDNINN
jgi:hypothetical protein